MGDDAGILRYLAPLALVAGITALAALSGADAEAAGLLLIVAVVAASLLGRAPGLVGAALAAAAFSFFFLPPVHTFRPDKGDDLVALGVFAVVALVVGSLVAVAEEVRAARLAAEASRTRAAFFAAAGHNLRTPLASVTASVSTLLSADVALDDEERRELLETIRSETDRLGRLVTKVLELSRIRAGDVEVERVPVDLSGLVQAAVRRLGPLGEHHRFELHVADGLPSAELDPLLVEQILLNLLENAVAFAPPGTAVEVSARSAGDALEVTVADHGPGIPEEARDRVFEEFARLGDTTPGTGLGLAIVRALTRAQGGTVRCTETPGGGGATLVLRFPLPPDEGRERQREQGRRPEVTR